MSKITIDTDNPDYWITYLLIKKYTILDEETTEKLFHNIINDRYSLSLYRLTMMLNDYPFFVTVSHGFSKSATPEGTEFWKNIYRECLYQEVKPFIPLDKETFIKFRNNWAKYTGFTDNDLYIALKEKRLKRMIAFTFPWEDTPEGHEFWKNLYYSL